MKRLLLTYFGLAAIFMHDWDGFVFEQTVRDFWNGLTPYAVAQEKPWYSFIGFADHEPQWYAYPPLPLLAMAVSFAPVLGLEALGADVPEFIQRIAWKLPMILGTIFLARVGRAWAIHLDREDQADKVEALLAWSPFLILVGPVWGMTDAALMAFFLLALLRYEQGKLGESGAYFAASCLIKPFPVLLAIPVLALALGERRNELPKFLGATAAVGVAVVGPFFLMDPAGFYEQSVGAHLGRPSQGLNTWTLWPLSLIPLGAVKILSMSLIAISIGGLSILATTLTDKDRMLKLAFLSAAFFLLWNRVLNEQYLVMVAAPALILMQTGYLQSRWPLRISHLYAASIFFIGFHFLTFIPPDIALPLFGRPVDEVAHLLRVATPWLWSTITTLIHLLVPASLVLLAAVALRILPAMPRFHWNAAPSLGVCLLLVAGTVASGSHAVEEPEFGPAFTEHKVSTFYYLWWHNPAHGPGNLYGNWLPVSQDPTIGYYTNNRGIARDHSEDMVAHGIDTAILSYHRGELPLYEVFQEEAARAGLWTTPLIELNQVYDTRYDGARIHRPVNEDLQEVSYAAYRTSEAAKDEIVAFVLDLRKQLAMDNQMRIDGKPVIFFYDAYITGVSFHEEDKQQMADKVAELYTVAELEALYGPIDGPLVDYHPTNYSSFFENFTSAPWRHAHMELHADMWDEIRERLEAELGPLFLIGGDAFNGGAGFEAGIVKSLVNLEQFDGSFIYSPSFAWGAGPDDPYMNNFRVWEDRNYWMQAASNANEKYSVVGLAPAYDDTVNRPTHGFIIPPEHNGTSTYTRSWNSMFENPPSMVAISTYNEYFEGSSIEDSVQFGTEWLEQTPGFREQFQPNQAGSVAVVHHERESRLRAEQSETDEPHAWGLDLIAAATRALDVPIASVDANGPAASLTPSLVLVDGGRAHYETSNAQVATWMDSIPTLLMGAENPWNDCGAENEQVLTFGDELRVENNEAFLLRDGAWSTVGGTCEGVAWINVKLGANPASDAACLDAILGLLFGETKSCVVTRTA